MNDHWKRLRERVAASTTRKDGIYTVVGCPPCVCPTCVDDFSILTDFDEAIARAERSESQLRVVEAERDQLMRSLRADFDAHVVTGKLLQEALDALALTIDPKAGFASTFKRVEEVLAKAGRR